MKSHLSGVVKSYVDAVNAHDARAFDSLFDDRSVVDDVGREFRGRAAIKAWSDREIFEAQVTLDVLAAEILNGETVLTTKVDGNFDRTGLPDPVVIVHRITVHEGKIAKLHCRLAEANEK